jgi:hypothetical protein
MHDGTLESTEKITERAVTRREGAISNGDSIFGTALASLNSSISVLSKILIDY